MSKTPLFLLLLLPVFSFSQSVAQNTPEQKEKLSAAEAVAILIDDEEYENAIARVEAALKKDTRNERLLLQRGVILIKLERLSDAKAHYKKIKRRLKKSPVPGNQLALLYRQEKNFPAAIKELKSVSTKFPDNAQARINLGDTYIEMAATEFSLAEELAPEDESARSKSALAAAFEATAMSNTPSARREALALEQERQKTQLEQERQREEIEQEQAKQASLEQVILGSLDTWITGWSNRDVDAYFSHYSNEYTPQDNLTINEWVAQKGAIISATKYIRIQLDNIRFSRTNINEITATFDQYYESDQATNQSIKELTFREYEDKWLIVREAIRPAR